MNKNQKSLIKLLNCAIKNQNFLDINYKELNWQYIISESREHKIYPLLYPVIKDIPNCYNINDNFKENWKLQAFNVAIDINNQVQQISKVFKEFNSANLPVIPLKGLLLRNLYPFPDFRTMSDVDIFIHEENIEKVTNILINMGYVLSDVSTPAHIVFAHKYYIPIEVHWKLSDTRYLRDISQFEREVWDNAVTKEMDGTPILCLGTEDFLIHLCVHMAVHMRSGGFGLRQLCDLVLFVEKESSNITWNTFISKIRNIGIEKFTAALFNVCNALFNLKIPKDLEKVIINKKYLNLLINDIFDSGVWGQRSLDRIFGNTLLNSNCKFNNENSHRMNNVINIICPPVNTLSLNYSYAKKHKILIPVAWVHHFAVGLFNSKYNLHEKLNFFFFSTSSFKKRNKLIKSLDL